MRLICDEKLYSRYETRPAVVALGTFDGVHRGHVYLLDHARRIARQRNLPLVVFTFQGHPQHLFQDRAAVPLLSTNTEKCELIQELGTDVLVMRRFDRDFASQTPSEFMENLSEKLSPSDLVVGENYSFGKDATGNPAWMRTWLRDSPVDLHVLTPLQYKGETVSSTRVRECIASGQMQQTQVLLGRYYTLHGRVLPGKREGRKMGFPTANFALPENKAIPRYGVYIAQVRIEEEQTWLPAVLNVGRHPTLPEGPPTIETFLLDAKRDLYNLHLAVRFLQFVRPEQKFEDTDVLKMQISKDVETAKAFFETESDE